MLETRRMNAKDVIIVTAAVCGAIPTKKDNPNLPTKPSEIAESILACYEAGASVAHIHVRDDEGRGSMSLEKFTETVTLVRKAHCPILLNLTTSGAQNINDEDRMLPFMTLKPELASFDAGTMNWMHSTVFMNEPAFLEKLGLRMQEYRIKPEIEIFDMGMLNTALYYEKKGILKGPLHFQLCLGAPGGMKADAESLLYIVNHLPENCTWGTFGIGRGAMEVALAALALGGNVRTGFEDNVYFNAGELATSNAQFVTRIRQMAEASGKRLATPDEARKILGL